MDLKRPNADPFLQAAGTAAQQAAATGRQFLEAKGFTQHVIGAGIEQGHHGLGAGAGREHHHGRAQLGRQPQGRTLVQQFGADDQIGGLLFTQIDRLSGRGHSRSQVPVLAEALGQHGAQGGMGLHHKNALQGPFAKHGHCCRRGAGDGRGSDLVRGALQQYFDVST